MKTSRKGRLWINASARLSPFQRRYLDRTQALALYLRDYHASAVAAIPSAATPRGFWQKHDNVRKALQDATQKLGIKQVF